MSQGSGVRGWQAPPAGTRATGTAPSLSPLAAAGAMGTPAQYAPVEGDLFLYLLPSDGQNRTATAVQFLTEVAGGSTDEVQVGLYESSATGVLTLVASSDKTQAFLAGPVPAAVGSTVDAGIHSRAFLTPYKTDRRLPTYAALLFGAQPTGTARLTASALAHSVALASSFSMPAVGLRTVLKTNVGAGASLPATVEPPPESIAEATYPVVGVQFQTRIVCYGDSITEGSPGVTDPAVTYPARLQAMVGPHAYVVNSGVSGNRVIGTGGLRNNTRLTNDLERQEPEVVVVLGGSPDLCQDTATAAALQTDYALLLDEMPTRAPGATVVCVTVLPYGNSACAPNEQARLDFNAWLVAGQGGRNHEVVELDATMGSFDGAEWDLAAAYDRGDGQHPNAAGFLVLAQQIHSQGLASRVWSPL